MQTKLSAWLCCWGLVLTAGAVGAETPTLPARETPKAMRVLPDLSREPVQKKLPDLIVRKFGLQNWGRCAPKQMMFQFQAVVANVGVADSPAGVRLAVEDRHGVGWGNRVALGPIPAGGYQVVTVPIGYPAGAAPHLMSANPHPFRAKVDPDNSLPEAIESNNESVVIQVDVSGICKPPAAVDLKINRVFVVTVVDGVEYTGVHVPNVPVGTFFDLCCEFSLANATPPLPQNWKIGLFLDGGLHTSLNGNDYSSTGHVCYPGGMPTTPVAHKYECALDHTGLVPEADEGNNRGSAPFSIVP